MVWKKLNEIVEMWKTPALGQEIPEEGKRFMALCIDPKSKNPYRGIARQVIKRQGHEDIPGFLDKSKLIIVESYDLLKWKVVEDLEITKLVSEIKKIKNKNNKQKEFLGLEDPDILIGNDGKKHLYFTIPFKYETLSINDVDRYEVCVGHAEGNSLEEFAATKPVLGKVNEKIRGFKEICPIHLKSGLKILAETFVKNGKEYSAIGLAKGKNLSSEWEYKKLVHDPEKESRSWCAGHSSPCRIFDKEILKYGKYFVGIMNGREQIKIVENKKYYGKFRPGLFLFDDEKDEIIWVDEEPLFEDPLATTITFASELVILNKKEAILYAHPNDSFVRAYKLNLDKIKKRIQNRRN